MKRVLIIIGPCVFKLVMFTASLALAWSAAGWKMALSLFLLVWAINMAIKTRSSV